MQNLKLPHLQKNHTSLVIVRIRKCETSNARIVVNILYFVCRSIFVRPSVIFLDSGSLLENILQKFISIYLPACCKKMFVNKCLSHSKRMNCYLVVKSRLFVQ